MVFSQYRTSVRPSAQGLILPQNFQLSPKSFFTLSCIHNLALVKLSIVLIFIVTSLVSPFRIDSNVFAVADAQALRQGLLPLEDLPLTGNYCVTKAGISLHKPPHTGQFMLDVSGDPIHAYWFWTGRSTNSPIGDDTIVLDVENDGGQQSLEVQAQQVLSSNDRIYTWHSNMFHDMALTTVASGINSYSISGFSIDNNAEYNHGVGVIVIYRSNDCPYAQISGWSGLDSFHWTRKGELGPDSNIICDSFPASTSPRTLSFNWAIGGVASSDRGNSIWYVTGTAQQPSSITPDLNGIPNPDAIELFDPLNGVPGHEWDLSGTDLMIPAGDTYVCAQIESPDDDNGLSAVWSGLITAIPLDPPDITIQKTAESSSVSSGEPVTFTVSITNTGAVTLTNVLITDSLASDCNESYTQLAVAATESYVCAMTSVTESFTNIITVTASTLDGYPVSDTDDASITVLPLPTPILLPTFSPTPSPTPSPTLPLTPSPTATSVPTLTPTSTPPSTSTQAPTSTSTQAPTPTPAELGSIGDRVWLDQNINGLQDEGEKGIAGVEVILYDNEGGTLKSTVTDENGDYLFSDLLPQNYSVEFALLDGYSFTQNEQGDAELDSNPDPNTGRSALLVLESGEQNGDVDAGLVGVPDLSLSKVDNGAIAYPGGVIVYTLAVTNTGNTTALDVVIVEFMPEHTTFYEDASTLGWVCEVQAPGDTQCTFDVGNLASGENFQTAFAVKINSPLPMSTSVINNQATLNSTNGISGKKAVTSITPLVPTYLPTDHEPYNWRHLFLPLIR